MTHTLRTRFFLFFALCLLSLLPMAASAATFTVTTLSDSGSGSLRSAIASAARGDTINFAAGLSGTITLGSTLNISNNITIQGPGVGQIAISGNNANQVFFIGEGFSVSISGMTIENGSSSQGGGLENDGGTVTVTNCAFTGNTAAAGGAIGNFMGLFNNGTITLTNCTITNNTATDGGGVANGDIATITNCTFTDNTATDGGAVDAGSTGSTTLVNDILYGDTTTDPAYSSANPYTSQNEIFADTQNGAFAVEIFANNIDMAQSSYYGEPNTNNHIIDVNPDFVNAPTDLHLQPNSPCIGAGTSANAPSTDINGRVRANPPSLGAYGGYQLLPFIVSGPATATIGTPVTITIRVPPGFPASSVTITSSDPKAIFPSPFGSASSFPIFAQVESFPYTFETSGNQTVTVSQISTPTSYAGTSNPITVTGPPTANSQTIAVPFQTTTSIVLSGNDPQGEPLTYNVINQPSSGTLSGTAPNLTYAPNSGFSGSDSFTFTVTDSSGLTSTPSTVTLNVAAGTPTANSQTDNVMINSQINLTLTGSDPQGEALSFIDYNGPSNGQIDVYPTSNGSRLIYVPNNGFTGLDSFTFYAFDSSGLKSALATVTLNVEIGTPAASSQSVTTNENATTSITLSGSDPDSPALPLTYSIASQPAHGTLSGLNASTGAVTYTPNPGYYGSDSFMFTVSNGTNTSQAAAVNITVNRVFAAPTANAQTVAVAFGTAMPVTLSGTDPQGETLTYNVTGGPSNGTLSGNASNFTYTPNTGFHGTDSFTFTVTNSSGLTSAPATVTLNVAAGTPTATPQSFTTNENTGTSVTLSGSDPDNPALPLTYAIASQPAHGMLSGTAPNLTYTPNPGYYGSDSFTFTVSNGTNTSTAATVNITVTRVLATVTGISATWGSRTAALTAGSSLLPTGRSTDVPWLGIKSFAVTLSAPETLSPSDVFVTGMKVASYGPVTVSGSGTSYTLTLAQPINASDIVTLSLGNAGITSFTGTLPVLPGDVGDKGVINARDLVLSRNMALFPADKTIFGDINGDGQENIADYILVRQRGSTKLP